ncbi:MAG: sigma-70 family RNA polymerase sigma factor [Anaerolineales bacterium]|nr:sigma-70 family RNA polymerase sigma factor [Anaerolineales bacterium]
MDIKKAEDTILIEQIGRGHEAALSELYDRYGRLVFSIAYHMVHNHQTAEEITLDVFTRVWRKAATYNSRKAKVTTWLTSLTRNRAIDILRREQVRPEKGSIGWGELPTEPVSQQGSPEVKASLSWQQEQVRQALAALPETQRESLALAYFRGMSHSEIAAHLEIPLGTIKGRIRAGMQTLKGLLNES